MSDNSLSKVQESADAICKSVNTGVACEVSKLVDGTVVVFLRIPTHLWGTKALADLRDRLEACNPIKRVCVDLA